MENIQNIQENQQAMKLEPAYTYQSNPFALGWGGIKNLFRYNTHSLIAVTLLNVLLFFLLGLTAIVVLVTLFAYLISHFTLGDFTQSIPSFENLNFLNGISGMNVALTSIIGLAICLVILALIQALQLKLAIISAQAEKISFNQLIKSSTRAIVPLLGYGAILIGTFIASMIAVGVLSKILGLIVVVIIIALVITSLYVGFRLTYVGYSIINLKLDPITAIKHSWELSGEHVVETAGAAAVGALIALLPYFLLTALAKISGDTSAISNILGLINICLGIMLVTASTMPLAARYTQLESLGLGTSSSTSSTNYIAIAAVIAAMLLVGSLSPRTSGDNLMTPFNGSPVDNSSQSPSTDRSDQTMLN
jgi:hypothetical protein